MLYLGAHLSASKGFLAMGETAKKIGANTFQFFTRNPRGGSAKNLDMEDIKKYLEFSKENDFGKIVAHAPYTMNLCSKDEKIRKFGRDMFSDDLDRMEKLPGNYYNFHPGSHTGQGLEIGIDEIADALNEILFPGMKTTVLLETMAGKGSEVGSHFEELAEIISKVKLNEYLGVCLDTCHVTDSGYNIIEEPDEIMKKFGDTIGFDRLKAVHLNDSKFGLSSHKDRHEKIGEGKIGLEPLLKFIEREEIRNLPIILETPNDEEGYAREIEILRKNFK